MSKFSPLCTFLLATLAIAGPLPQDPQPVGRERVTQVPDAPKPSEREYFDIGGIFFNGLSVMQTKTKIRKVDCPSVCDATPGCIGYSISLRHNSNYCSLLQGKASNPTPAATVVSIVRSELTERQVNAKDKGQLLVYPDIDVSIDSQYVGFFERADPSRCGLACKLEESCSGFLWQQGVQDNAGSNSTCLLKAKFDGKLRSAPGKRFFLLDWQTEPTKTFPNVKNDAEFEGDVISEVEAGEECTRYCSLLSECKGFSYNLSGGTKKCKLFRTITKENQTPGSTSMSL